MTTPSADADDQIWLLEKWSVPKSVQAFLIRRELVTLIQEISERTTYPPSQIALLLGQLLPRYERRHRGPARLGHEQIRAVFDYAHERQFSLEITPILLEFAVDHPQQPFDRAIIELQSEQLSDAEIESSVRDLRVQFGRRRRSQSASAEVNWIMKALRPHLIGVIPLLHVREIIERVLAEDSSPAKG
jgi:Glu-tRNA(Gln) amidotransferase subunit E-like FAD-binding protein